MRAIWLHGPQKAQFTNRTLPRVRRRRLDHRRVGAVEGDELAVGDQQRRTGAVCSTTTDGVAIVGADAQEVAVAGARLGLDELVADVVAEAERVEHVLPVGPAEDERLAVLHLPVEQLGPHAPPRVEVDVLDPADVVDRRRHRRPAAAAGHGRCGSGAARCAWRRCRCRG